jgi:hypothetical protein
LKNKNSQSINKEIEKVYNKTINPLIKFKENRKLRNKVDILDRKFDIFIRENKSLKQLIDMRTQNLNNVNKTLKSFKNQILQVKHKKTLNDMMRLGI